MVRRGLFSTLLGFVLLLPGVFFSMAQASAFVGGPAQRHTSALFAPPISVNPQQSHPVSSSSDNAACAKWANEVLQNWQGSGLQADDLSIISNCYIDAYGRWFMATGPDDPRLDGGPVLTAQEAKNTKFIRDAIAKNVDEVLGWAATQPARMVAPNQAGGKSFRTELDELYSPTILPVTGHYKPGAADYDFYWNRLLAVALDPDNTALSAYLSWQIDRITSLQLRACSNTNPYSKKACVNQLAGIPFYPGRLLDELLLAQFSKWVIDHA